MFGCSDVGNEFISETAQTIFLNFGMKLGDNKGNKNSTARFFIKILILADFGQTYQKMAIFFLIFFFKKLSVGRSTYPWVTEWCWFIVPRDTCCIWFLQIFKNIHLISKQGWTIWDNIHWWIWFLWWGSWATVSTIHGQYYTIRGQSQALSSANIQVFDI